MFLEKITPPARILQISLNKKKVSSETNFLAIKNMFNMISNSMYNFSPINHTILLSRSNHRYHLIIVLFDIMLRPQQAYQTSTCLEFWLHLAWTILMYIHVLCIMVCIMYCVCVYRVLCIMVCRPSAQWSRQSSQLPAVVPSYKREYMICWGRFGHSHCNPEMISSTL